MARTAILFRSVPHRQPLIGMISQRMLIPMGASGVPASNVQTLWRTKAFSASTKDGSIDNQGLCESTWLGRVSASIRCDGRAPPAPPSKEIAKVGAISFAGMGALSLVHFGLSGGADLTMIIGSMGASAVLVYAAPALPLAQPRNVVGGHLVSAVVGVTTYKALGGSMALAVPAATSGAIMAMMATSTLHPPAGGTVLIALMGSEKIVSMGYWLLCPVGITSSLIVVTGVALNNVFQNRRYPKWWC